MRRFLINWAYLNLLLFALILVFPAALQAVFQLFNGWGIVPVALGMLILALLPGRLSWRKARVEPLGVRTNSLV
jgi:hypothetical protein